MVIWGLGAWTPVHWAKLGGPDRIDCRYADGTTLSKDMWTYSRLEEGEVYYDRPYLTAAGLNPPVLHVEKMNTPVCDEATGRELRDYTYLYFKNGNERMDRAGLQGGSVPVKLGPKAAVEPYGHDNDEYQADAAFADYLCAGMAQTMSRFEGVLAELPRAAQRRHWRVHAR